MNSDDPAESWDNAKPANGKPLNHSLLPYDERVAYGLAFEANADHFLTLQGYPIKRYLTKQSQHEHGESAAHCEIKNDDLWQQTGNLFIEVRERSRRDQGDWKPSGIHEPHNPWHLLIGDYDKLWLFPCRALILLELSGKYELKLNAARTAEGFLVPLADVDPIAVCVFENWFETER